MTVKPDPSKSSKAESKAEHTHATAMKIIEKERDARLAKTDALRAQRIARDTAKRDASDPAASSKSEKRS